jgi:hypothetical protein
MNKVLSLVALAALLASPAFAQSPPDEPADDPAPVDKSEPVDIDVDGDEEAKRDVSMESEKREPDSPEKVEYCDAVDEFRATIASLDGPPGDMPVHGIYENVLDDLRKVRRESNDVINATDRRFDKAEKELIGALKDLPDDISVDDARERLRPHVDELKAAQLARSESLTCDTSPMAAH